MCEGLYLPAVKMIISIHEDEVFVQFCLYVSKMIKYQGKNQLIKFRLKCFFIQYYLDVNVLIVMLHGLNLSMYQ